MINVRNDVTQELEQERLAKIQAVTNISDVSSSFDATTQHLQSLDQHQKVESHLLYQLTNVFFEMC